MGLHQTLKSLCVEGPSAQREKAAFWSGSKCLQSADRRLPNAETELREVDPAETRCTGRAAGLAWPRPGARAF